MMLFSPELVDELERQRLAAMSSRCSSLVQYFQLVPSSAENKHLDSEKNVRREGAQP